MARKLNVVLITVDSLRADHVGCYGPDRQPSLTPNLDAFAARSVVMTQAFAQGPYTTFSLPSLFTGRYPCRLKPMGWALRWQQPAGVLVDGVPTLTERLREAGYHTAGFHSNPLVSRLFGFHKGFDVFYDDVLLSNSTLPSKVRFWTARLHRVFRVDPYSPARALNARVLAWLAGARQPFFLWIHYMDTHGPYLSRKVLKYVSRGERLWRKSTVLPAQITPRQRELLRQNYHRQITSLDTELGRLWQAFDREELFDRSLVMVSADHGDEFFEHGGYSHSHKLYDELLHVPLLVRFPGAVPEHVEELTELIQIPPTVLDCVGLARPELDGFDAGSFLPVLHAGARAEKSFILSEAGVPPHERLCIRTKEWKLIWEKGGQRKELYQLSADPHEQVDVAAKHPEIVAALDRELAAHCAAAGREASREAGQGAEGVSASEAEERLVVERLRDLGYL